MKTWFFNKKQFAAHRAIYGPQNIWIKLCIFNTLKFCFDCSLIRKRWWFYIAISLGFNIFSNRKLYLKIGKIGAKNCFAVRMEWVKTKKPIRAQLWLIELSSRAGHFRYFLIFSIIKNDFFSFFKKSITYFCTSPI